MGEVMNCKPGQLAIIVAPAEFGHVNGLIVEILKRDRDFLGLPTWLVQISTETWVVTHTKSGQEVKDGRVRCPDAWLKPVSGLPITDDVTNEVTA